MPNAIEIQRLDHRDPRVAAAIHSVWVPAYTQEATLLAANDFSPLAVTVQDLQAHRGLYFGASVALEVVGALGTETAPDAKSAVIASLVVAPAWQRRGIGRRLLTAALAACGPIEVSVSTGARNAPALALYASFGFVEAARRTLGPERIEVVTLRRSA